AGGGGRVAAAPPGPLCAVRAHRPVALDRAADGVEEVLLAERLRQELHGAGLHGLDGHRDVAMPGEKDDWQCRVRLGQLALQVQTAQTWQAHVEHEASRRIGAPGPQDARALANVSTLNPTDEMSRPSESRTDASSST